MQQRLSGVPHFPVAKHAEKVESQKVLELEV